MVQGQNGNPPDPRIYELSEVLEREFTTIKGAARLNELVANDPRPVGPATEQVRRKWLYRIAQRLDLSALCLSGGGIRSASISLGVIQALNDHNLLENFEYLSTVSGGGYIGSWLSAWLNRQGATTVLSQLKSKRDYSDAEVPAISHLRKYSNYLTPRIGLFSADTWAAVAIVLRNILVNWLILLPVLALVVIGVKLLALGLTTPAQPGSWPFWTDLAVGTACLVAGCFAFGYKLGSLYLPAHSENAAVDDAATTKRAQNRFLFWSLFPAMIGGLCFVWLSWNDTTPAVVLAALAEVVFIAFAAVAPLPLLAIVPAALLPKGGFDQALAVGWANTLTAMVAFAFVVYVIALGIGKIWADRLTPRSQGNAPRFALDHRDFIAWIGGILVFSAVVWVGAACIRSIGPNILLTRELCVTTINACVSDAHAHPIAVIIRRETVMVIFGVPWFLLATILAHSTYLLLNSMSRKGDVEREWLGRASGWHFIAALAWIILAVVVLLGPALYYNEHLLGENAGKWLSGLTAASGAVTAFLGKSGLTGATGKASSATWTAFAAKIALAIAGPLFAALLLIMLAVVVDWAVLGERAACLPTGDAWDACRGEWRHWLLLVSGLLLTVGFADALANINAFSIHSIYRNRLIRCFLGGARDPHRHPDGFTDFDWDDDLRVAQLRNVHISGGWRPFHVLNMTLNLADTNRLAWQQRKAAAFCATPLFCGNEGLGYRPTEFYAGPRRPNGPNNEIRSGISLGSAMAISGAAVSPNMGYLSSMSLSFLLTFFNVRLGAWLGNPGVAGETPSIPHTRPPYRREGPLYAVRPLLSELFGMTTEDSPYVYLSDGGHFEDLGLYEMVRRRCKRIVIVDGDQDGKRGFEDLGNAVRKIWIDQGVRISFKDSKLLGATDKTKLTKIPYFAVGKIEYLSDEPVAGAPPEGKILYIKPLVRGDEDAADVIAYRRANPAFPAQSTANQWFDESQFESYRRLGYVMADRIISAARIGGGGLGTLFDRLDTINEVAMEARQGQ